MNKYLVFTDLDGTLLDHYSYSFSPALPMLKKLQKDKIPVILNTSKTKAELKSIQNEMDIAAPLIVENGSAIFFPKSIFPNNIFEGKDSGEFWKKELAKPRKYWLDTLNKIDPTIRQCFKGFSEMSINDVVDLTGLDPQNAELALQREYGEPLYWEGDETQKQSLIKHVEENGGHTLQGGRFLHVGDKTDKGIALQKLTTIYTTLTPDHQYHTIALGDSHNDIAMLESCHTAVLIKSPVSPFPELSRTDHFSSTKYGPKGWAEMLEQILYKK